MITQGFFNVADRDHVSVSEWQGLIKIQLDDKAGELTVVVSPAMFKKIIRQIEAAGLIEPEVK